MPLETVTLHGARCLLRAFRKEELDMLALLGVLDIDVQALLGEEALLLGHIDADKGQVRLRLEACHEGNVS